MSTFSIYILTLYFFTLCAVFVTKFANIKIGNVLAVAVALTSFGVATFRPSHFPDVDSYKTMFEFAASGEFNNPAYWFSQGEPGFKILSYLMSLSGLDFTGFLVTMSAMSCLLLLYISRISGVSFSYLWFTYFSFYFITRDLGVIRVAIASHLIVIFFLQRAFIWQAVSIIIATLTFQSYAFVVVLAKLFSRVKIDWFSISLLFLISFIFAKFVSFENFNFLMLEKHVNLYEDTHFIEKSGSLAPVVRNLFFAFFLYFLFKNEIKFKHFRIWIWSAFFSASFYIMASEMLLIAQRFAAYFGAVVPLAMAFIMQRQSIRSYNFFLVVLASLFNFGLGFYYYDFIWLNA